MVFSDTEASSSYALLVLTFSRQVTDDTRIIIPTNMGSDFCFNSRSLSRRRRRFERILWIPYTYFPTSEMRATSKDR